MPQANDPSGLSQGNLINVSDIVFANQAGNQVDITSAGSEIPLMSDDEYFEIRGHSDTVNNGLYRVNDASPAVGDTSIEKVFGSDPIDNAVGEAAEVHSSLDTNVSDLVFENFVTATATVANRIDLTSAGSNLPAFEVGERFEVTNNAGADNNGAYEVISINTVNDDYTATKLLGVAGGNSNEPANQASDDSDINTEKKTVMWDTAARKWMILEQGGIDATGASGQAIYSKAMIDWLDDTFLRANAPFPMRCIDSDAGKYLFGQDANGNNSGWLPEDVTGFSIRTRKMVRNGGFNEFDSSGNITARSFGCLTVDAVENPVTDTAFGYFGTDTTVDNTFDLTFAGPTNEAIEFFKEYPNPDTCTFATATTITRATGSFIDDGYVVGGQVTIRNSDNPGANDGTFAVTAVAALTLTCGGETFTTGADTNAILAVDNDNAFRLGMRERDSGDPEGSTFAQADLNSINKPNLGNFVFQFPLATGTDLKITDTDAFMDGNAPYTSMTLTMYATPQARGAGGILVGGPYNFGFIMDGNDGTKEQCFSWLQYQLRKLIDIDDDGDTNIGRTIGLLARFVGDTLEVGSADGGLTQTTSPDGGGTGLYIDNLNSADANNVVFYDSLGQPRVKPTAVSITLDANETLNSDPVSDGTLFFKNTIENAVDATFVVTAGTGADGTFVSTAQFPASLDNGVGAYVEVVGLTGADEAMNGIYQVTALTSTSLWSVTRRDGATIVTTAGEAASIDEHPVDSPDAIVVHTNIGVSGTDISFNATGNLIEQTGIDAVFSVGDYVEVIGSTSGLNDGLWEVTATGTTDEITVQSDTGLLITTQGTGPSITVDQAVQVPLQTDFTFSFDYSNNSQGGRTGGTNAKVQAKAVGRETAQYTESTVQTITTDPLIIPLTAQGELNVTT